MPTTHLTPTTVITGFLGSGKTTLLNALLRHPALEDTAVLVNEFGDVGIDHLLVDELDDEAIVLLNAGCLCCTIRNDLVGALSDLRTRRARGEIPPFRRVVIETTGLADPAPILHTLLSHEALTDDFCVDGIVTTVDGLHGERQLDQNIESVKQAAVADRIVLTKTDLAGDTTTLRERLRAINTTASVLEAVSGDIEPAKLLDTGLFNLHDKPPEVTEWLRAVDQDGWSPDNGHHHRHDDGIASFYLEASQPLAIHRFVTWIERLLETEGERVLRLKGVLDVEGSDAPIVVHGVQHVFHPLTQLSRWPDESRRSQIVLIGRELDEHAVRSSFDAAVVG